MCLALLPRHGQFLRGQPQPPFVNFCSFQTQILQEKPVGFSGIRTRIVIVEGKHTDHLTRANLMIVNYNFGPNVINKTWSSMANAMLK